VVRGGDARLANQLLERDPSQLLSMSNTEQVNPGGRLAQGPEFPARLAAVFAKSLIELIQR